MQPDSIKEAIDIFNRLSPENQAYMLTLARVAEAAENGIKKAIHEQTRNPPDSKPS